ncbi:TPA: hypothetical protein HA318_00395, partial [Candidatus Micrarchaeota archaeon]|nr:hypothetical protein [Candidatus Micrarchaeota archaeon]
MPRSKQYEQPVQNEESALQNHGQIGVPYSSGHNEAFQSNVMRGIAATILLIAIGSTAYHFIEGWSWIDSIYFSST